MAEELELPLEEGDSVQKITGVKKALFSHISKAQQYVQGTTFMEVDLARVREAERKTREILQKYRAAMRESSMYAHAMESIRPAMKYVTV